MIKFFNLFKKYLSVKKLFLNLLFSMLLIFLFFSYASSKDLDHPLLTQVENTIERPLPTIASILGQEIKDKSGPIIVIGYLENSNPPNSEDWGKAIGWFLMHASYNALRELAVIPPYLYNRDGSPVIKNEDNQGFDRKAHLSRVANRVGARFGITGKIGIENNHFDIILELIDYKDQKNFVKQREGDLSSINEAVKNLAQTLLTEAIATLKPRKKPLSTSLISPKAEELRILAGFFSRLQTLAPENKFSAYQELWKENSHLSSVASLHINAIRYYIKGNDARISISKVMAAHPQSIALQTFGNLLLIQNSINGIDLNAQNNLKKLILSNPNNIGAWLALSSSYTEEQVKSTRPDEQGESYVLIEDPIDNHLGYASAVALGIEIIHRWPNYYRGWWGLSYSLYQYGTLVRGVNYWKDIPEENRKRYKAIMPLVDDYLNKAIKAHPAESTLYTNMISIDKALGRDWKPNFYRAIELEPNNQRPYREAFNFSQPQWGGTEEDLREIYTLAKKNNPNVDWPEKLFNYYSPDPKPSSSADNQENKFWAIKEIFLAIFLVSILFLGWYFSKSSKH